MSSTTPTTHDEKSDDFTIGMPAEAADPKTNSEECLEKQEEPMSQTKVLGTVLVGLLVSLAWIAFVLFGHQRVIERFPGWQGFLIIFGVLLVCFLVMVVALRTLKMEW